MRSRVAPLMCVGLLFFAASLPAGADGSYTLKEGETLFAVSRKSGVPIVVLSAYNGITNASRLAVGTIVRVPSAYSVKKGDTLYGIAKTLSVPVSEIMSLNGISKDSLIKAGQVLYVPAGGVEARNGAASSPASVETAAPARPPLDVILPHPGKRESDKGKLWWMIFQGAAGDLVRSATAGEVKWAATWWGYGKVVIIKSADGSTLMYRGSRELLVRVGDRVLPGTEIARLGESLQGGGTKLYVSINDANGNIMDPEKFFSAKSQS